LWVRFFFSNEFNQLKKNGMSSEFGLFLAIGALILPVEINHNEMSCKPICLIEDNNHNRNVSEKIETKLWKKTIISYTNDRNNYNFQQKLNKKVENF
jgi:hypothetical protein